MIGIRKVFHIFLDVLFPQSTLEKKIETITSLELSAKIVQENRPVPLNALTLFEYRDALIKHMIWALKYKGSQHVARLFAEVFHDVLLERLSELALYQNFTDPLLIPIPLSAERLHTRRFNQVERITEELNTIAKDDPFTVRTDILTRIKHTESQTKQRGRKRRRRNLEGAFLVTDTQSVKGRNIILLDDVITTGSTIHEATHTLLRAGALQVTAMAIAH